MSTNEDDFLNKVINRFFKHQFILKMYHFQTEKFAAHKASDSYLEKFTNNLDKFFEIYQGIEGKITKAKIKIEFDSSVTSVDANIKDEINNFSGVLSNLFRGDTLNKYSSLINLRDEMLGDLQQFKYLLTFN